MAETGVTGTEVATNGAPGPVAGTDPQGGTPDIASSVPSVPGASDARAGDSAGAAFDVVGDGAAKADAPAVDETPAAEAVAPAAAEYALTVPPGMNADDPLFGAFKEIAAKHGLSLEAAQDIVDMVAPKLTDALTAPYQLWKKTQETWQAEAKADSEFGGPNFARNMASIAKVLDQHCDPKLRDALNVTGAGNHPAIIRSFWRLAQILTEPSHVAAAKPASVSKDAAGVMYPSHTKADS
jgi:hypothetical protein